MGFDLINVDCGVLGDRVAYVEFLIDRNALGLPVVGITSAKVGVTDVPRESWALLAMQIENRLTEAA